MSKVISTDVPADLAEQIEEVRESDESRSATVRRLVRDGLDANKGDSWRDRIGRTLTLAFLLGFPTFAAASGGIEPAALFIGIVLAGVLFEPWINSTIGRIPNPFN